MNARPAPVPSDGVRDRQTQIAADLRALILSGDIPPGERIPSTAELINRYGVTNQTVQRAVRMLKKQGYVEGRSGLGVFATDRRTDTVQVSHYPVPAGQGRPYPWISAAERGGRRGSSQLIHVGETPAPAQVAAAFGIERGTPVVTRNQLLCLDDEPAELVWTYYTTDVARGTALAEKRKIKGGTPAVLEELGFLLHNAVDRVSTRLATVEEFIALRMPEDIPILRQFRVIYTDGGRPIEVAVMVKAGHRYELQYELPVPSD